MRIGFVPTHIEDRHWPVDSNHGESGCFSGTHLDLARLRTELRCGVKAGVPATEFFETGTIGSAHGSAAYSSGTKRYTLGVAGEWHVTNSFGLELDAMYHRFGYGGTVTSMGVDTFSTFVFNVSGNAWDFPLLAKYRLGGRKIRAFRRGGRDAPLHRFRTRAGRANLFFVDPWKYRQQHKYGCSVRSQQTHLSRIDCGGGHGTRRGPVPGRAGGPLYALDC